MKSNPASLLRLLLSAQRGRQEKKNRRFSSSSFWAGQNRLVLYIHSDADQQNQRATILTSGG